MVDIKTRQQIRDHIFCELTRSICPECRRVIDAQVLLRDGAVYLRKRCPEHGWHEALVSSDAEWYMESLKYNKPGAIPFDFATHVDQGCPSDCGLCPEHQQHTCVGLIEITTRCNLACPTCFADAGVGYDLSLAQVESMLDRFVETEGDPEVIQISGGEPTLHPQLMEILAAARNRGIYHVMLNTNGLRLAQDVDFVRELSQYKPIIYLQFDGLTPGVYQNLRGRDLRDIKRQALENVSTSGMNVQLVATVAQGINDNEVGDILRFALEQPAVLGVCYQPVTFAGRCLNNHDPLHRMTLPDVLNALEAQTEGLFRVSDFRPVPCPHPTCLARTYAFVDGDEIVPIPRILNVDDYLDFVTNRLVPEYSLELHSLLESLWSMSAITGIEKTTADLNRCCDLSLPAGTNSERFAGNFFMIHVHGFMDEYTLDVKRLMKCCVHELLPDGRAIPFCAYNTLGYREHANQQQGGQVVR
ncbi:MAG: radical SAM protein [Chloroflexi bacterium]|nr:radical SAM protein [Chloroflexota bacterium]